jgi:hypothetical protein
MTYQKGDIRKRGFQFFLLGMLIPCITGVFLALYLHTALPLCYCVIGVLLSFYTKNKNAYQSIAYSTLLTLFTPLMACLYFVTPMMTYLTLQFLVPSILLINISSRYVPKKWFLPPAREGMDAYVQNWVTTHLTHAEFHIHFSQKEKIGYLLTDSNEVDKSVVQKFITTLNDMNRWRQHPKEWMRVDENGAFVPKTYSPKQSAHDGIKTQMTLRKYFPEQLIHRTKHDSKNTSSAS